MDDLEPHILSIIVGCPLWRGCIDVNGKKIETQKFVHNFEVSVIEGGVHQVGFHYIPYSKSVYSKESLL